MCESGPLPYRPITQFFISGHCSTVSGPGRQRLRYTGLHCPFALTTDLPCITLLPADTPDTLAAARQLFQEYADSLGLDIAFQHFAQELASLPGEYAAPRGVLLLAYVDGMPAGCCALRPLDTADYPHAAEMRRLYVRKMFRGFGLGRQLTEATLDAARLAGYTCVLLDTLDDMEAARNLYAELGFASIAPYYYNPLSGAHYLKADLR